jgi:hypothetical protein
MKKQSLRIFLMTACLAILVVSSARAQSNGEQRAFIPFSFNVGSKNFPPGEYNVRSLNPQSDKTVLSIRSADGRMTKAILAIPVQTNSAHAKAKLVFNRYGDQYFLAQVWAAEDETGLELQKSRAERALERDAGEVAPERLTVALNPRRH